MWLQVSRKEQNIVLIHPSFSYEKKLVRELMTHRQISSTKILVQVSHTRNLDRLPSAQDEGFTERKIGIKSVLSIDAAECHDAEQD